eukprot:GHVN01002169.1.p1 GENE.GHVN01002169.1~~GHVN01002169.1.p1  ORF type:complete len:829 (+),score=103.91 GHVN01002169.1:3985-6471(+)
MSLEKKQSNVRGSKYIWTDAAPSVKEKGSELLYAKALILGKEGNGFKCRQVDPPGSDEAFIVPDKNAFNSNEGIDPLEFNDAGLIPHYNSAAVLDFFKARFMQNQIYTYVDPLLVVINPFDRALGQKETSIEKVKQYRDASDPDKLPPHIFALSRLALTNLHGVQKSQTLIVSGESGAGKTESTKHIMKYFAETKGVSMANNTIQESVMAGNPILEAFGNAKTVHNNNSSRFGRFMKLLLGKEGGILNGSVEGFLLERIRVVNQEDGERNFHIFYQLVKGAPPALKQKYKVKELKDYRWLVDRRSYDVEGIDDAEDFKEVMKSLVAIGLTPGEIDETFSIVSGVLLMGSYRIDGSSEGGHENAARIDPNFRAQFEESCALLSLDPTATENALTYKTLKIAGQADTIQPFRGDEGVINKESLGKGVYDRLFAWLISKLNKTIEPKDGNFPHFMGMLDIFGFEVFDNNSLEQLFINITNEMLQKNFITVVFTREQQIYREEGISEKDLVYTSNDEIITALTHKNLSVCAALQDTCLGTTKTDQRFLSTAHELTGKLQTNKLAKPKIDGDIRFIVRHTIGEVPYNAYGFVMKNSEGLRPEFVQIASQSTSPVMRELFEGVVVQEGSIGKDQLASFRFIKSLEGMMELIAQTEPHFVRCVKPNEQKKPKLYSQPKVMIQLIALSILEALHLRDLGYSYRRPFGEFLKQFKGVNPGLTEDVVKAMAEDPEADAHNRDMFKTNATALCKDAKLVDDEYKIGKTKVFLTKEAVRKLAVIQRDRMSEYSPAVEMIEAAYKKYLYLCEFLTRKENLRRIQAHCRKHLDMAAMAKAGA